VCGLIERTGTCKNANILTTYAIKVWRVGIGRTENRVPSDENKITKPITVAWIQH
jgi:hypothetical protein